MKKSLYDVNYGTIRIEVKCSAYLQAWEQKQLSTIAFSIAPAQAWTPQDGYDGKPLRHSEFYIFCLLNKEWRDFLFANGWKWSPFRKSWVKKHTQNSYALLLIP
ncbi:MAG: hypothetical protein J6C62_03045 [Clostridia bacterium]|nr:hypothetical protein [Clostridia bacterium]